MSWERLLGTEKFTFTSFRSPFHRPISRKVARQTGIGLLNLSFLRQAPSASQRAADFVDQILKGANPALLPIEPSEPEIVVNLKTASAIGLTIPPQILLEANRVIK